jgi:arylsulfatase A-like enzyme
MGLLLVPAGNVFSAELAGSKPNIVLVITDDQGMGDLSCMGNEVVKTPNIDKFYEQSTRFTDF